MWFGAGIGVALVNILEDHTWGHRQLRTRLLLPK
jgi:hypothetical protein